MTPSTILITISALWVLSEIVIARMKSSKATGAASRDAHSIRVIWLFFFAGTFLASMATGVRAARMPAVLRLWAFWGGLVLIVIGIAIRWIAIRTLERYFTVDVAIATDHKVVDRGIYRIVRHPSYAGTLLSMTGLGLAFVNWLSLALCLSFAAAGLAYRIRVEERALTEALGDEYRAYAARTKRLIPGVF